MAETEDYPARVREINQQLAEHYPLPPNPNQPLDPLSELIFSLLAQRTRGPEARTAFACLRERYPDWRSLMQAPVAEIEDTIAACTWPEQKAPRLKEVLLHINAQCGGLSLDFLERTGTKAAHDWLKSLPGIGPKTGAAILASSTLQRRILPVDSHHHRITLRLGLLPARTAAGPAHKILEDQLPPEWDAADVSTYHALMKRHGQETCTHTAPRCARCVVLDLCPFGQQRTAKKEIDSEAARSEATRTPCEPH